MVKEPLLDRLIFGATARPVAISTARSKLGSFKILAVKRYKCLLGPCKV
jgi:hypothetical protein